MSLAFASEEFVYLGPSFVCCMCRLSHISSGFHWKFYCMQTCASDTYVSNKLLAMVVCTRIWANAYETRESL